MVDNDRRQYLRLCAAGSAVALAGCSSLGGIREFRDHFEAESDAIGDETLDQELELMDEVLDAA